MKSGHYWRAGILGALALAIGLPVATTQAQRKFGRRPSQSSGVPPSSGASMTDFSRQMNAEIRAAIKEEVSKQAALNSATPDAEPLDLSQLANRLPPVIGDLERVRVGGEKRDGIIDTVSQVTANYANDDRTRQVKISIYDVGGGPLTAALKDIEKAMSASIDNRSEDGYQRTREIQGFKAVEKFHRPSQSGEISLVVGERIGVRVEGMGVEMGLVESGVSALNLPELAKLGS